MLSYTEHGSFRAPTQGQRPSRPAVRGREGIDVCLGLVARSSATSRMSGPWDKRERNGLDFCFGLSLVLPERRHEIGPLFATRRPDHGRKTGDKLW